MLRRYRKIQNKDFGLGYIESPKDDRDYLLPLAAPAEPLPLVYSAYDKSGPLPILNQRKTPHCVAYACSTMKTYQEKLDEGKILSFDTAWLYQECKKIDGYPDVEGTFVRAAMSVLKNKGLPLSNRLGTGAQYHKIAAYYRVPTDLHSIKLAIYQYGPVVAGIQWYESWFKPVNGVLPRPDKKAGGHSTEWFGWDDTKVTPLGIGAIQAQNSWTMQWGDNGIFYIPYQMLRPIEIFKAADILGDGEILRYSYNGFHVL